MSPRPEMSVGAVLLGLMAAALVVGIVAITVSRAGSGGESSAAAQSVADRPAGATSRAPTQPRPRAATRAPAPTRAPAISRAAVIAVLQEYVDAYDAEDTAALGGLLAPHVSRHSGRSVQHGATEALAEYQQQFDELVAPHYVLDNLSFASTAADARIGATYSITSDEAPESTGSIGFHLSRSGAGLRIDAIVAVPD
jgi:hypothetical protein